MTTTLPPLSENDQRRLAALQEAAAVRGLTVRREQLNGVDGLRFYEGTEPKNFYPFSFLSRTCDAVQLKPS